MITQILLFQKYIQELQYCELFQQNFEFCLIYMLYVILFCTLQLNFSGKIKHIFLYLEFPSVLHKHKNSHFNGNEKFKTLTLLSVVLIQRKGHKDCWNLTKSQNVMKFQWRFLQFLKHHPVAWKNWTSFSRSRNVLWQSRDKWINSLWFSKSSGHFKNSKFSLF